MIYWKSPRRSPVSSTHVAFAATPAVLAASLWLPMMPPNVRHTLCL